jgi:hypothetical protein
VHCRILPAEGHKIYEKVTRNSYSVITAQHRYTFEFDEKDRPLILQLAGNTASPIIELANLKM